MLLVAVATGSALLPPANGPPIPFVTARGEPALLQGSGLYRFDPAPLAREGLVWDAINLVIGVPALVLALFFAHRGSLRGRLAVTGLSLYFAYVYVQYATMVALNPLFPVYIAIFALSLVNLFVSLALIDPPHVKSHVSPRFPRRFFAGFAFLLSSALLVLWGLRIAAILRSGRFPPELAGMVTLQSQAFDLGLVVPLALASGILLLRDHAWGYVLTALTLTFGFMMCLTIPAWIVVPLLQDGKIQGVEAGPFLLLSAAGFVLVGLFLRNVREDPKDEHPGGRFVRASGL
ncbi:MAG: hypothetical protein HY700_10190 [Gemmatimonadetes bacterium]|nr:hypothetical protein [Gemmatimonadota bacterium]